MAMKFHNGIADILIVSVLMLAPGCREGAKDQHALLEITVENATSEILSEAVVIFGKYRCTRGTVIPGATKTHSDWRPPVGTNAVVEWRDSKQAKQTDTVSLAGIYDPSIEGRLVFTVGLTNVTVGFRHR